MRLSFLLLLILFSEISFANKPIKIICIGDSLTEGYGVSREDAYPAKLEKSLQNQGHPNIKVVNAGISGATSRGWKSTLRFQLKYNKPDLVIFSLGANDALRGLPVTNLRNNLKEAFTLLKEKEIKVLVLGMKAPRNMGAPYIKLFDETYPLLVKKFNFEFMPFMLKGIASRKDLNLPDGIHPNPKGYEVMVKNMIPYVKKALK